MAPLVYVAVHVEEAPGVGHPARANGGRIREDDGKTAQGRFLFLPCAKGVRRPRGRRTPFRFRGKAVSVGGWIERPVRGLSLIADSQPFPAISPVAVQYGILPADLLNGMFESRALASAASFQTAGPL